MKQLLYILLFLLTNLTLAQDWEKDYESAKKSYVDGNFNEAAKKLGDIVTNNSDLNVETKGELNNLHAVCLLNDGKAQEAVNLFLTNISDLETSDKRPSQNYYTATSQLGIILYKAKQPDKSFTYIVKALNEASKIPIESNQETITLTQILATICKSNQEYEKADSIYSIVLDQKSKVFGEKSEELNKTLITVANMHYDLQNYDKSIQYYNQASDITESIHGTKSQEYAVINHKLAEIYQYKGDLEGAENIHLKNLRIFKKEFGEKSPQYLSAYINLADLYLKTGRLRKADNYYSSASKLLVSLTGTQNEEYARLLNQIGLLKEELGEHQEAINIYLESLSITSQKLGKKHGEYATTLQNLAIAYQNIENYQEAEKSYLESLDIRSKTTGNKTPEYAEAANSIATFYVKLGRYNEALDKFEAAHKIVKENFGVNHIRYATSLTNLGHLFELKNDDSKALEFYKGAIQIFQTTLGTNHSLYGDAINNLAKLYLKQKKYQEAEDLFKDYKSIVKKKYGNSHLKYSIALTNLARIHEKTENYKKAIDLYSEVLEITKSTAGSHSMIYNEALSNLARVETAIGDITSAKEHWILANKNYFYQIESFFPSMSEKERSRFYNKIRYHFTEFNMFVYNNHEKHPDLLTNLFENQIITKSMLFKSSAKMVNEIRSTGDDETIKLLSQWQSNKELLTKYYTDNATSIPQTKKDSLESAVNSLEKLLSEKSSGFKSFNTSDQITLVDIQTKLLNDQCLLEMIRVDKFDFEKGGTRDTNNTYYLGLLVNNSSKHPKLIFINNGRDLEQGKLLYYRNTTKYKVKDYKSYAMFWERIKKEIPSTCKTLYFSPDGVYNQINLQSIRNPETNQYIIEEIQIKTITNSSEILNNKTYTKSKTISLYGNPDFSVFNKSLKKQNLNPITSLPGTKKEIDKIKQELSSNGWTIQEFESKNANESTLKSTTNSQVLHIATHGFFKSDVQIDDDADEDHFLNNPLLKSGLYLSINESNKVDSKEDGILYAYEAMNLNLDNTELVVLSACETGLGEVKNGEGVYGLQRSLRVAGARSVLISLWKVDDEATQELMTSFYKNWLTSGDKHEALRLAQNEIRKKYPLPYYWGGFIIVGI